MVRALCWQLMAVRPLRNTVYPDLDSNDITVRSSSLAEPIEIYHEDFPPLHPLKDATYWKISHQASLADALSIFNTNTMYSSATVYRYERAIYPDRRNSVLDSSFGCYLCPEIEDSLSQAVALTHGSTVTLRDTYCSSNSSTSTCSAVSQRQSLLPPLPQKSLSSMRLVDGQSHNTPRRKQLPATPLSELAARMPASSAPSKRSITPLELEQLKQSSLPPKLRNHSRAPSHTSGVTLGHDHPSGPSMSSVATTIASTSHSAMSLLSNSETLSHQPTACSSFPVPPGNGSMTQRRERLPKPIDIAQPEPISPTLHGRSISSPLKTKSSLPVGADFDLGLPSHEYLTRRQSPAPPTTDASVSTPQLTSAYTASTGTPASASYVQPLLSPFHEQFVETSAFDSDTDDEGTSSHARTLYEKVSRPLIKPSSRTRAETVPAASAPFASKGTLLQKRISKQNFKSPGLPSSITSESGAGSDVALVRISDPSVTSPVAASSIGASSPPVSLPKKTSYMDSPTSRSRRMSNMSKDSKKSSTSFKTTSSLVGDKENRGRRKTSSGGRVRSWFSRVFAKRNTL